ncbi:PEP-CTERM sorting domain-containing protein [Massilia forsythiae]|uniref:PEP-CTERM sorting domain-containing protein n=1 Tax=Massilia forsythiae TaxID=2728020 RepID=A0A7Z2ZR56_9BURK|nr:NF038120 family PEP-CTERM protein [Massilia forsythiae]QJD98764.1 PEP-CTERM sorting domain-containing protein [Massilia forsythiae]
MKRKTTQLRPDGLRGSLRALVGGALVAGAALAAPAQAGVITFEGAFGPTGHGDAVQQAGYEIGFFSNVPGSTSDVAVGLFADGSDSANNCLGNTCLAGDISTYYQALNDSYLDIVATNGGSFSIKGFDAGFLGSAATSENPDGLSYPAIPGLLLVQGFMADGSSSYETYQLSGLTSGTNNFSFGRFAPSAAFSSLQFVEVAIFGYACRADGSCQAFQTDRGQFGIDNIVLADASEVPEPSSALLLGLGLIGLAARTRRKT